MLDSILSKNTEDRCQTQFTPGWKSAEWTWSKVNLWNDLGFSLCAMLSVCHMIVTSDNRKKSEMGASADLVCYC